jgi:transposase-like protein
MQSLQIAAGTVAVHAARLVIICAAKPGGMVAVRDLASGECYDVSVGQLSARTSPAREADAERLHAEAVRASPQRYRAAERRESLVVAALVRPGQLQLSVEQTSAVHGVSSRTLWRWIARYRASPTTAALLLSKRGVPFKARLLSADTEAQINASIDLIYLTQPRGTYQVGRQVRQERLPAAARAARYHRSERAGSTLGDERRWPARARHHA